MKEMLGSGKNVIGVYQQWDYLRDIHWFIGFFGMDVKK
jgi:hypothetical protein